MAIKINQTEVINDQQYAVNLANCIVAGNAVVYGPTTSPIVTVSCTTGTGTVNCATSNYFKLISLTQASTAITFTNVPSGLYATTIKVETGTSAITWPAAISWKDNTKVNTQNGTNTYFIFLFTVNQGTSWNATFLTFT